MEILDENINMSNIGSHTLLILFVICHLLWMFVFCTLGQHLHNVSAAIFYKGWEQISFYSIDEDRLFVLIKKEEYFFYSYEVPWYLLSKKTQKLLFFIIARADKPNDICIGKMFTATHEFFTAVRNKNNSK